MLTKWEEEIVRQAKQRVGTGYDLSKNLIWDEEIDTLIGLSTYRQHEGYVVEIGTFRGYSAALMGIARWIGGGVLPLFTVDHHKMDSEDALAARTRIKAIGLWDRIILVNGPSGPDTFSIVRGCTGDRGVSLLFIDGDHSEPAVLNDIRIWLPLVMEVGIVVFHDVGRSEVDSALQKAIKPDQIDTPFAYVKHLKAYMKVQFNASIL